MKHKIITALLSLVIAFGLWAYVITVEQPEQTKTYYNIPVALEGESVLMDQGLMLVAGRDATVDMVLKGNRSDLINVNSQNITVVADLTKVYDAGVAEIPYTYSFPGNIANNAISVMSRNPDTVRVEVAERVTKEVPVVIQYVGEAPDPNKYIVDKENAVLDYPKITAVGPDMIMDQIDHALVEVDLTDRKQTFSESYRYTMVNKNGEGVDCEMVTTNVPEVRLELKIQMVKDVPLTVTVVSGGGATATTSSIRIDPVTIRVSGNEKVLSKLTEISLGTIELGSLVKDTTLTFPINLEESVTNLTGVTEASVQVSFPDLAIREFSVINIRAMNVPEGLEAELVTKALKVSVRGPKDLVRKMKQSDLSVTVDLKDAVVGTATVKAEIHVADAYPGVGEVGTYTVTVSILDPEDARQARDGDENT